MRARTFGSAFHAVCWHALWIYFTGQTLGNAHRSGGLFSKSEQESLLTAQSCTTPITSAANSTTDTEQHKRRIVSSRKYDNEKVESSYPCTRRRIVRRLYAFRPERLLVNHIVHETFSTTGLGSSAQTLASGTFHGVLHPTKGTATSTLCGANGLGQFRNSGINT